MMERRSFWRILLILLLMAVCLPVLSAEAAYHGADDTLYFRDDGSHETVYLYAWHMGGQVGTEKIEPMGAWPGQEMIPVAGVEGLYCIQIPNLHQNAISFSDGADWKTDEQIWRDDGDNCYDLTSGGWGYHTELYRVIGTGSLCGTEWDQWDENNDMRHLCGSIYQISYPAVPAGDHYFMIIADGTWEHSWPDDNSGDCRVHMDEPGEVTIRFDEADGTICVHTGSGAEGSYTVVGSEELCGTEWDPADTDNAMVYMGMGIHQIRYYNVPAGTYSFQIADAHWTQPDPSESHTLTLDTVSDVAITFFEEDRSVDVLVSADPHRHHYVDGVCYCGKDDPNYIEDFLCRNIYFCDMADWAQVYIYAWSADEIGDTTCWVGRMPGMQMEPVIGMDGYYCATVPVLAEKIMFHDGNGRQTAVLEMPGEDVDLYDGTSWGVYSDRFVAAGQCGEDVFWTLDADGLLAFFGTGEMTEGGVWEWETGAKEAVIGSGITGIPEFAFSGCFELTQVSIPDTVTDIAGSAFYGCRSLRKICVDEANPSYASDGQGFLFDKEMTCLLVAPGGYEGSYTVPEGVTAIGERAFHGCAVEDVRLCEGLERIEEYAFLESEVCQIQIPESVTFLGSHAFESSELQSVTLPQTMTSLEPELFAHCSGLRLVTLPEGLQTIGNGCFMDTNLKQIRIPDSVTTLGVGVFWGCTALKEVVLPEGLTSIPDSMFLDCIKLEQIRLPDSVVRIEGLAFSNSGLTGIALPEGVTTLGGSAFSDCAALAAITVPKSVTTIGRGCFEYCRSLKKVVFLSDAPALGSGCFRSVTAEVSYPGENSTWDAAMDAAHKGKLTWVPRGPKITLQPQDVTAALGKKVTVKVAAEGEGLTYQWFYADHGSDTFRKTDSFKGDTYSATMTADRVGRRVYCVIRNADGEGTRTKTVTLKVPLKITAQPSSVSAYAGKTARVTVTAQGKGLTYRWYYANAGSDAFTRTDAFKGSSYSVTMSEARAGRRVYCVITDAFGQRVKTNTVTLKLRTTLKITAQPASVSAYSGKTAKITVGAQGDGLEYAWYYVNKGGDSFTKTDSFKGATYSLTMSAARNGRRVYCVVTDKYGTSVRTDTVKLKQRTALKITRQPVSVTVADGKTAKVTLVAQGEGLTFRWYYANEGSDTFTRTTAFRGSSYSVTMTDARDGRRVYCEITDKYGKKVKSEVVTLSLG